MIKDWNELNLRTYYEIYKVTSNAFTPEDEKIFRCAAICAGIDYDELLSQPIASTEVMVANSAFLYTKPERKKVSGKHIKVNGNDYTIITDASDMTTAQYIDYQSVIVEKYEEHITDLLSIILIPKGHTYNDGYDRDAVKTDMDSMSVTEALGITDFFLRRYRRSLRRSLLYSSAALTTARIMAPKEIKEQMREVEKNYQQLADELLTMSGKLSLEQLLN